MKSTKKAEFLAGMAALRKKRGRTVLLDSSSDDEADSSPSIHRSSNVLDSPSKTRSLPKFVPVPSPKKTIQKKKKHADDEEHLIVSQGPLSGLNLMFLNTITTVQRDVFSRRSLELGARVLKRIKRITNSVVIHVVSWSQKGVTMHSLASSIGINTPSDIPKAIETRHLRCVTEKWVVNVLKAKEVLPIDYDVCWCPLPRSPSPVNSSDPNEAASVQKRPASNLNINYGRSWDSTSRLGKTISCTEGKYACGDGYSSSDREDEEDHGRSQSQSSSQISEIGRKMPHRLKTKLACQSNAENATVNHNEHITKVLDQMAVMHGSTTFQNDQWRVVALKKAAKILKQLPYKVESVEQIKGMKGIGHKSVAKIEEILETKTLVRLQNLQQDPTLMAVSQLSTIWGVGTSTARELVRRENIYTVDELKRRIADDEAQGNMAVVNSTVVKTVNVYDDLMTKIPRSEVETIRESVLAIAVGILKGVEVQVMGSYRRGNLSSGDVDMLFNHPTWRGSDGSPEEGARATYLRRKRFLTALTDELLNREILAFHITDPSISNGGEHWSTSYMGVTAPATDCPKHRRIDIKCYPVEEMPFALLYFTGNAYFNRSMRWFAKRKGLTLSDHGMAECIRQHNIGKIFVKESVRCNCEQDIFEYLGLVYLTPQERECNGKVVEAFGEEAPPLDSSGHLDHEDILTD